MKHRLYLNYFANIGHSVGLKVSIARKTTREQDSQVDFIKRILAPKDSDRVDYQSGLIDWEEFTERYLDKLNKKAGIDALVWLDDLLNESDVTILCHCKPGKDCHRNILGAIYKIKGYEVFSIER